MAPNSSAVAVQTGSASPYQLDPSQTLRAANALLKKMQTDYAARQQNGKADLLGDESEGVDEPIWLCVTTKKHIIDQKRLKPGKISLPHSLTSVKPATENEPGTKVCLITVDPQRQFKDLISHPNFPEATRTSIARVIGLSKLKAKYKSFEARRQLASEYDLFLADDRVVTYLPKLLGKVFYHGGSKRPIPVVLSGRKEEKSKEGAKAVFAAPKPEQIGKEIEGALGSAYVHLSPGTNTSVKVGTTRMSGAHVQANIEAVVQGLVKTYIPQGWRNIKGLHVKGPRTASLPIWLADELWEKEDDVLELEQVEKAKALEAAAKGSKKRSAAGTDGAEPKKKQRKSDVDSEQLLEKEAQKVRKDEVRKIKEHARTAFVA